VRLGALGLLLVLSAASADAQTAKPTASAPVSAADRQAIIDRARLYLSQKRDAEAVAELRRAARLGPLDRDLALRLAAAERADGNRLAAERQLRSVADRFQSVQALLLLAQLQAEQKNAAGALASLRSARTIAPNSEEVLSAFAEALYTSPTPDAAIPVLDALTRLCPNVAGYQQRLGLALLSAGDAEAAVVSLQEAARRAPDATPTLVALGRALVRRGLYADAQPHLLRAVSLSPDDLDAAATLAETEAALGDTKEAEDRARRVLARNPANPTANAAWAAVLMKQERFAEARDALQKAVAADPKGDYDEALSRAFAGLQDSASAEQHLDLHRQKEKTAADRVQRVRRETAFGMRRVQS
jgi:tetratricopeptide (TPR) repeat protein